jgi:hypothetical protein
MMYIKHIISFADLNVITIIRLMLIIDGGVINFQIKIHVFFYAALFFQLLSCKKFINISLIIYRI